MSHHLREAASATDWQESISLLQHVYVQGGYTSAERAAAFMTRERLAGEGAFLVAVNEADAVVGAVIFLKPDSGLIQLARDGQREFRLLAVQPSARGGGVGEALVQACIVRAKQECATGLVLWTQPTMPAAHRLYERLGFLRARDRDEADPRGFTRLVYRLAW